MATSPGALLWWATLGGLAMPAVASGAPDRPGEVVLRGTAVCLDRELELLAEGEACPDRPEGGWGLRAEDGALYRFSATDERTGILQDPRVRSKPLEIALWKDGSGELAIVHLYTLIDGRRHAPHYYCELCAIRANAPGPCWCCQAPFEFREPLVEGESAPE